MKEVSKKQQAINFRKKGYSYKLITEKTEVPKSTLSAWLKAIPFEPNREVRKRIKAGPIKSGMIRNQEKIRTMLRINSEAVKEIGLITQRDLWMLGLGLYLGEGSKTYEITRVINSDPAIVKLAIKWFKDICGLGKKNITVAIHLYPDNNVEECLTFWSKELKLPISQFRKTQFDYRKDKSAQKTRLLPHGTAHVTIVSSGNPEFGVNLHRRIMGWIEGSLNQIK